MTTPYKESLMVLIRAVVAEEPPARIREIGRQTLREIKQEVRELKHDRSAIERLRDLFCPEGVGT